MMRREKSEKEAREAKKARKGKEAKEAKRAEPLYMVDQVQTMASAKVRRILRKEKRGEQAKAGPSDVKKGKPPKPAANKKDEKVKRRLVIKKTKKSVSALTKTLRPFGTGKANKGKKLEKAKGVKKVTLLGKSFEKPKIAESSKSIILQNFDESLKSSKEDSRFSLKRGPKDFSKKLAKSSHSKSNISKKSDKEPTSSKDLLKAVKIGAAKPYTKNETEISQQSEKKLVLKMKAPFLKISSRKIVTGLRGDDSTKAVVQVSDSSMRELRTNRIEVPRPSPEKRSPTLSKSSLRSNLKKNLNKIPSSKTEVVKKENESSSNSTFSLQTMSREDQKKLSEQVLNIATKCYDESPCMFEKYMIENIKKCGTPYLKAAKSALSQQELSKESIISILLGILHCGLNGKKPDKICNRSVKSNPEYLAFPNEIWGQGEKRSEIVNMLDEMKDSVRLGQRAYKSDERLKYGDAKDDASTEFDTTSEGEPSETEKSTANDKLTEIAERLSMKAEMLAKSNKLVDTASLFPQTSIPSLSSGRRSFFTKKSENVKKVKKEKPPNLYSETESSSEESVNSQGYRESDLIQIKGVEHEQMILTPYYKNAEYKVVTPLKDLLRARNKSKLPDDPTNEKGFYGFSTDLFWANQRDSSETD